MNLTISNVIQDLQAFQKEYGDLEVWVSDDGLEKPVERLFYGTYRDKRVIMVLPEDPYGLFGMDFYSTELEALKRQEYPDTYK